MYCRCLRWSVSQDNNGIKKKPPGFSGPVHKSDGVMRGIDPGQQDQDKQVVDKHVSGPKASLGPMRRLSTAC
jgi:hypothetical protein